MALCLAARLHTAGESFADYYLELLEKYETRYRVYERRDITLFDESLKGSARDEAKAAGNARKEATVAFFASLEGKDAGKVARVLIERMPEDSVLPTIKRVFHAGDGTYIEFDSLWFELRASGTDAVLRYYMEGRDPALVAELNEAFTLLVIS